MDDVALAGTIGTWVGVFVGLVALIAIVGPVLVWAAARTERSKALQSAGEGGHRYISKGVHLGPNIRLFRRAVVPLLNKEPVFAVDTRRWDATSFTETTSTATWVQLAELLRGYGVVFSTGDNLLIKNGKALLPVHRIWVLTVGLLGRYGTRGDQELERRKILSFNVPRNKRTGSVIGLPKAESEDTEPSIWVFTTKLLGISGQLRLTAKSSIEELADTQIVAFKPSPLDELARIQEVTICMKDLLMLAVGCLPLANGHYCTLSEPPNDGESDEGGDSDNEVHFVKRKEPSRKRASIFAILPSKFAVSKPSKSSSQSSRPKPKHVVIDKPIPFRLEKFEDIDEEVARVARPYGGIKDTVWSLEPVKMNATLSAELKDYMGMTFVPSSAQWVRVDSSENKEGDKASANIFIWRPHAQKIAYGLLSLIWNSQGYLVGLPESGVCLHVLQGAANELSYILVRVKENTASLSISDAERNNFINILTTVDKVMGRGRFTRSSYDSLYQLDQHLRKLSHQTQQVNDMIGVLTITNEEFRTLLRHSVRYFEKTASGSVDVDLRAGKLNVQMSFGGIQDFVVDLDQLYENWAPRDETISVRYTFVVLASLRACLRSFLLSNSPDGGPLLSEVLSMEDIVYVA